MKRWNIFNLVGEICFTLDDGEKVYNLIYPELVAGNPVELDFAGVRFFASPFFNAAFGRLLKDLASEELDRLLKVSNMNPVGRNTLKLVIKDSEQYYRDPVYRKAVDEVFAEQLEEL